jgi:hypothetical protein
MPLSHLIERLHKEGASYDAIVASLTQDGFSLHQIRRAYIMATRPRGFRRTCSLIGAFLRQLLFPLFVIGIALFSVASILASAEEPPKLYPLYVTEGNPREVRALSYGSNPAFADTEYFNRFKQDLLRQQASFISANLDTMVLAVYKDGLQVLEVPIATKGRPGSWWETPAGVYRIEYMHEKHRSGISGVYQPWSIRFQGNFYIHGWPYHPNGERVSSAFSGGCIRLEDTYAEQVYKLVELGMPVIVFEHEKPQEQKTFTYAAPAVDAAEFIAVDLESGFVFAEQKREAIIPMGPFAKLVTALVAAEYINLDATIQVPRTLRTATDERVYAPGSKVRVYNLLFPLLLENSDEAAEILASVLGRERFITTLNKKADSLGMKHTHFADTSGVDEKTVTTLSDIYQLLTYIQENRSFVLSIASGKVERSAYGKGVLKEVSPLMKEPYAVASIEGVSERGAYGLSVLKTTVGGSERTVLYVLIGSSRVSDDTKQLRSFVIESYE